MANRKITQFTALASGAQTPTMVLPIVDPSLGATDAANKKVTLNNLFADLGLNTTDKGIGQTGVSTGSAPAASAANQMKWYFNTTDSTFKLSRNTGSYGTVQSNFSGSVSPAAGATQTIDLRTQTLWTVLLPAGNITISTAGTPLFPTYFTIQVYQDPVGGRTITWGATFFNNSAAMTIQPDATANSATTFNFYSDGTNCFLISWSSDAGNFAIPTSTFAGLPASPGYVAEYLLTDTNKGLWYYNTNALRWVSDSQQIYYTEDFPGATIDVRIAAAHSALPSTGGVIVMPPGTFTMAAGVTITKPVIITGSGNGTILNFTGFTAFWLSSITANGSTLQDFELNDSTGSASSIAIRIGDETSGSLTNYLSHISLKNLECYGPYNAGVGYGPYPGAGIGLQVYGIESSIQNCLFEGWGSNFSLLQSGGGQRSNAWSVIGSWFRQATYGIQVQGSDDLFINGCTIEGNSTGIIGTNSSAISVTQTHFENNNGSTINAQNANGNWTSSFCTFHAAAANSDIIISGTGQAYSYSDLLNSGVTNNSSGTFRLVFPVGSPSTGGAGVFTLWNQSGIQGTNATGTDLVISGYAQLEMKQAIAFYGSGALADASTIAAPSPTGAWTFARPASATNGNILFSSKAGSLLFTDNMALGNAGNRWQGLFTTTADLSGSLTLAAASNLVLDTATGTKIGTGTTQKLGFWNATPVVQPATTGTAAGFTAGAGTNVTDQSTFTGGTGATAYRISDIVLALKQTGLMAS